MCRKEQRGRTFEAILDQVKAENCESIMQRARFANRVAKLVAGNSRLKAYRVKHGALRALASRFPDRVQISHDPRQPEFVVVSSLITLRGLHVPREVFEGQSLDQHLGA